MLIHHDAVGRILSVATTYAPAYAEWAHAQADQAWLEIESDLDGVALISGWYVADGALIERPALGLVETLAVPLGGSAVLSGLPDTCRVIHDGVALDVVGGALTLTGDVTDTYALTVEAWPHLAATVTVEVA
jgi:hypothetical protein